MIGKKKGRCKIEFADGDFYEGEIEHGKANGKGKYTFASGGVCEGQWKDDKMYGKGIITWANGVYDGEFKDGKAHGKGEMTCTNGDVYEGEYKDGEMNGTGKKTYANRDVYEGEWKDSEENGQGKMTYTNGDVYEGEWQEERQNGKGTMTYTNGDVYDGDWKDSKKHGPGTMKEACGDVYKQVYNNGERLSSKRCLVMINGPPSLRPRTGEPPDIIALNDEDKECELCFHAFTTDTNTSDDEVKRRLPVLGTCTHYCCLGCILERQTRLAQGDNGRVPHRIPCMTCSEDDAFCPSEPRYDRRLIRYMGRRIPVINGEEHSD
ncbi:hypothetical protein ACHAXR_009043 [Thalassiosira sp. AJA248-18]